MEELKPEKKNNHWVFWSLFFFALIIVCGQMSKSTDSTSSSSVEYSQQFIAIKKYLQENLNDPSSLEIVNFSNIADLKNGTKSMRVAYRAKNPFNATILKNQVFFLDEWCKVVLVTDYK